MLRTMCSSMSVTLVAVLIGCGGGSGEEENGKGTDAGETGGGPDGGTQVDPADDLRFLNEKHIAAILLRPKRITESELFAALPEELDWTLTIETFGLDPRRCDRALFMAYGPVTEQIEELREPTRGFDPDVPRPVEKGRPRPKPTAEDEDEDEEEADDDGESVDPEDRWRAMRERAIGRPPRFGEFGYVIRMDGPIDREAVLKAKTRPFFERREVPIGESTGYLVGTRHAFLFLDDRTIVGGPVPALEELVTAKQPTRVVAERLAEVEPAAIVMVGDLEGWDEFRTAAREAFDRSQPKLPPAATNLPDVAMKVRSGVVRIDVTEPDTLATLTVKPFDAADTDEILAEVEEWIGLGKTGFTIAVQPELERNAPPGMEGAVRSLGELVQGTTVARDGDDVVVTVPHPEGTLEVVRKLAPAIVKAQEAARLARFQNNLQFVGIAFYNYFATNEHLPAAAAYGNEDRDLLSWRVALLPMLDARALQREFRLDEPWDSEHNESLLSRMPKVFESPGVTEPGMTTLMVVTGEGTPFHGDHGVANGTLRKGLAYDEIESGDGMTNVILAVYAASEKAVPWTKPEDLAFDPKDPLACIGEIPETGLMVVMADGAVRTLPKDIAAEMFSRLVRYNDGERVRLP